MAVKASIVLGCTITETLTGNIDGLVTGNRNLTYTAFDEQFILDGTTNPAVTKSALFLKALAAGVGTVDLTALSGSNGATVDGTGLKIRLLRIKNLGVNNLTVAQGASNGYGIGGTKTIYPNGIEEIYFADGLTAIDSTHKTLDLTGTTTQTSEWTVVMG